MGSIKNWFVIEHAHPHIYSGVVVWLLSHGWLILGWTILSAPASPTHPFLPLPLILSTPLSHFVCLNNLAQIQASLESHVSTSPQWLVLQHIIIIILLQKTWDTFPLETQMVLYVWADVFVVLPLWKLFNSINPNKASESVSKLHFSYQPKRSSADSDVMLQDKLKHKLI